MAAPFRVRYISTLVSSSGRYGGPETVARHQARLMCEVGIDAVVVGGYLRDDPPPRADEAIIAARVRRWLPVRDFVGLFSWDVARLIVGQIRRADVVHINFARELIPVFAAAWCVLSRRPYVVQPHGMLTSRTSHAHNAVDFLVRPLVKRATAVVALTDAERAQLSDWLGKPGTAIDVVSNPPEVAPLPYPGAPVRAGAATPTVLFAARLHPRKRVADFLAAAAIHAEQGRDVRWLVAGADQGEGPLVEAASETAVNVEYLGALRPEELHDVLDSTTCFVLPAQDEPWGQVLVSAMLRGVPVVVARSAALAEAVDEFAAGAVFDDGDASALSVSVDACLTAMTSGAFAPDRAGINARFSERASRRDLEVCYRAVLAGSPLGEAYNER